ncbi:MAG: RagB/SusD family nutrient uptake outer membrane protein [Agriterribacter sp.]
MMKNIFFIIALFAMIFMSACKKNFLEIPLQSSALTEDVLANKSGVQSLLVGTYHDLTGMSLSSRWWTTSGTNWQWSDITSGDAYRGGYGASDEPEGTSIEIFQAQSSFTYVLNKFKAIYDGIARSNAVLRAVDKAQDMTDQEKNEARGEARFLRGHYHFQAKIMWNKVPYVDENVIDFKLSNDEDIWTKIEDDFKFAFGNLSETKQFKGQANKWAAASYLAKTYMFEKKFADAKTVLDDIIANGKNAQGIKYDLNACFEDNFNGASENSKEAVFQIQFSADKESYGYNSNLGEAPATPNLWQVSSWGSSWKQPSFNLVNAFKTDDDGLPMPTTFNDVNMDNDMGLESWDWFVPYQGYVDPRLDWTVGRRGVPYLDYNYGVPNPGKDWINNQSYGGPYTPIKGIYRFDQQGTYSEYYTNGYLLSSAVNYNLIRFADVLLWAAEAEVEVGSLDKAREYVNRVRTRAKEGCTVDIDYSTGSPSANYLVGTYDNAWTDQEAARTAVRFERRLELAMEGHRFFDLVRWGIAAEYINDYLNVEKTRITHLQNVSFAKGKNEYFPLPQIEIDLSNKDGVPLLKQNPGY